MTGGKPLNKFKIERGTFRFRCGEDVPTTMWDFVGSIQGQNVYWLTYLTNYSILFSLIRFCLITSEHQYIHIKFPIFVSQLMGFPKLSLGWGLSLGTCQIFRSIPSGRYGRRQIPLNIWNLNRFNNIVLLLKPSISLFGNSASCRSLMPVH